MARTRTNISGRFVYPFFVSSSLSTADTDSSDRLEHVVLVYNTTRLPYDAAFHSEPINSSVACCNDASHAGWVSRFERISRISSEKKHLLEITDGTVNPGVRTQRVEFKRECWADWDRAEIDPAIENLLDR